MSNATVSANSTPVIRGRAGSPALVGALTGYAGFAMFVAAACGTYLSVRDKAEAGTFVSPNMKFNNYTVFMITLTLVLASVAAGWAVTSMRVNQRRWSTVGLRPGGIHGPGRRQPPVVRRQRCRSRGKRHRLRSDRLRPVHRRRRSLWQSGLRRHSAVSFRAPSADRPPHRSRTTACSRCLGPAPRDRLLGCYLRHDLPAEVSHSPAYAVRFNFPFHQPAPPNSQQAPTKYLIPKQKSSLQHRTITNVSPEGNLSCSTLVPKPSSECRPSASLAAVVYAFAGSDMAGFTLLLLAVGALAGVGMAALAGTGGADRFAFGRSPSSHPLTNRRPRRSSVRIGLGLTGLSLALGVPALVAGGVVVAALAAFIWFAAAWRSHPDMVAGDAPANLRSLQPAVPHADRRARDHRRHGHLDLPFAARHLQDRIMGPGRHPRRDRVRCADDLGLEAGQPGSGPGPRRFSTVVGVVVLAVDRTRRWRA